MRLCDHLRLCIARAHAQGCWQDIDRGFRINYIMFSIHFVIVIILMQVRPSQLFELLRQLAMYSVLRQVSSFSNSPV
jgi:hypothetical protein